MIGVSPAYLVSLHGMSFGPAEIAAALPGIREAGFQAYQPEIFLREDLERWTDFSVAGLREGQDATALAPSVFVGHFAHDEFGDAEALRDGSPSEGARHSMDMAAGVGVPVWAVPLMRFSANGMSANDASGRVKAKLLRFVEACAERGIGLGLELARGNALGGLGSFKAMLGEPGLGGVKLVFDTGHAFVAGEDLPGMAMALAGNIAATHICDTGPGEKRSLAPGRGQVPIGSAIRALRAAGWEGSLDLEISCSPDELLPEYSAAREGLEAMDRVSGRR